MRTSKKIIFTYDLFGKVLETPFINQNDKDIESNWDLVKRFLSSFSFKKIENSLFYSPMDIKYIIGFLNELKVHEANRINYFEKDQISRFIQENYKVFDVAIIGGDGNIISLLGNEIKLIERSFDLLDRETIRISGVHSRLGGSSDTKFGLDDEVLNELNNEEKKSSSTYLIENRNPILLIYPIHLKKVEEKNRTLFSKQELEQIENTVEHLERQKNIPIGVGIGFPKNSKLSSHKKIVFYINDRTKWWNLMNRKDNEEDE